MNRILFILVFTCVYAKAYTQVNYVKNPSFEEYFNCPDDNNKLSYAKNWHSPVDTIGAHNFDPEYLNVCATFINVGVPNNANSYQYPHFGDAYIGSVLYYDQTLPYPPFVTIKIRDYAQGHLIKPLQNGKTYCVSFWVVMAETSGYNIKNIGAYLDNGNINKRSPAGDMITDVVPQLNSSSIIKDTMNWIKVEGSFVATGNETHITLGNFTKQADVDTQSVPYYVSLYQYSYYLIDDVSVIPIDLDVKAGADTWVEQGSKRKIGRIDDSATVLGLDCKWYKKGVLIDSGAIISVNANSIKGVIDTYVVVQTICGVVKSDTVLVKTVGLGVHEFGFDNTFIIFPNPSNGTLNISASFEPNQEITAKIYDFLGRAITTQHLSFTHKQATLKLEIPNGTYFLELQDETGNVQRERIVIN